MTSGKARLWTGISCVGTLVLLASGALLTDAPARLFPTHSVTAFQEFFCFLGFFFVVAIVMLPFDLVGGVLIPAVYESQRPLNRHWLRQWSRSVAIQSLFFSITFFMYLQIGRQTGAPWLIVMFAVLQATLLAGQDFIWQAMTANWPLKSRTGVTQFVGHLDQRFVGGITGLPGLETILVPLRWQQQLRPACLRLLIQRRQAALKSGGRRRGILLAMLWNILGFSLAIAATGAVVTSVAEMLTAYFWFLLFSFSGLLLLPELNRRSVFALDRMCADDHGRVELQEAIVELDQLTEQDPARSAAEESVFQPVPCPVRRCDSLSSGGSRTVSAWNVARTALFLSWALGGPLARAVHCNVGRPELWAMLPGD